MITDVFRQRLGRPVDRRWVDGAAFVGPRGGKEEGVRREIGTGRVGDAGMAESGVGSRPWGVGQQQYGEALVTSICRPARCIVNDLSTEPPYWTTPNLTRPYIITSQIYRVSRGNAPPTSARDPIKVSPTPSSISLSSLVSWPGFCLKTETKGKGERGGGWFRGVIWSVNHFVGSVDLLLELFQKRFFPSFQNYYPCFN